MEGPFYDEPRNEFRFVDIWEQKFYVVDLAKGPDSLKTIDTSASIGCVDRRPCSCSFSGNLELISGTGN